jgi:uncharacterized protein
LLRIALILLGLVSSMLAIAGVLLPGLPATPFVLLALWAFARSDERLYARLQQVPILQTALAEARRFEEKRAVLRSVKITAVLVAWSSVLILALTSRSTVLIAVVGAAALAGSLFMWWIPTDKS